MNSVRYEDMEHFIITLGLFTDHSEAFEREQQMEPNSAPGNSESECRS